MKDIIYRTQSHVRHFTVTGYVVNKDKTKLLLINHKKLNKWLPAGGHLEENEVPHEAAEREVLEETGITVTLLDMGDPDFELQGVVDDQIPRPYAMFYQIIPKNTKDDEHIHLDMLYVFEADEAHQTNAQLDEVSDVRWWTKEEVLVSDDVFDSVKGFAKLVLS